MTWQDRQGTLAYTSPSGTRFELVYEDLSREIGLKTTSYEYADANFTVVQQFGHTGRQVPVRIFFNGPEYDINAAEFEAALVEEGTGILETPLYGTFNVIPVGSIKAFDKFKTGANQRIIEVSFFETGDVLFQSGVTDNGGEALTQVDLFNSAVAADFDPQSREEYISLLDKTAAILSNITGSVGQAAATFTAINNSINSGINTLIGQPLALASQTLLLIGAPARSAELISDKFNAYTNLLNVIINDSPDVRLGETFAMAAVSGLVIAASVETFETRQAALNAATTINQSLVAVDMWRESKFSLNDDTVQLDTGESMQALQAAVSAITALLVVESFSLATERTIILDRARTLIDLAAELFGSIDEKIDQLITVNDLSGDSILELKKGSTIRYFI